MRFPSIWNLATSALATVVHAPLIPVLIATEPSLRRMPIRLPLSWNCRTLATDSVVAKSVGARPRLARPCNARAE